MFFRDWAGVLRVIVVGTCAYVAVVAMLRLSGKRTLAKMNAFDFVVTVALGSTLASIITSERVVLAEGVTALGGRVGSERRSVRHGAVASIQRSLRSPSATRPVTAVP